jgi:hypothetical protein
MTSAIAPAYRAVRVPDLVRGSEIIGSCWQGVIDEVLAHRRSAHLDRGKAPRFHSPIPVGTSSHCMHSGRNRERTGVQELPSFTDIRMRERRRSKRRRLPTAGVLMRYPVSVG